MRSASALTLTSIMLQDNYVQMHLRVTRAKTATTRQKDGKIDGGNTAPTQRCERRGRLIGGSGDEG